MALALLLLLAAPSVWPWGPTGHRVVAEIAEQRLSPDAQRAVRAILGRESLSRASTWADEVRSDPDTARFARTIPWHFIDIPDGVTLQAAPRAPGGDALSALQAMERDLRSASADTEQKRYALRFLVHLVGDIHQPLHVGNGRDRGGNWCMVKWFGRRTSLHAVWDNDLIDHLQLSYTEYVRFLLEAATDAQIKEWSRGDYETWIAESRGYRDQVYPAPRKAGAAERAYCKSGAEQEIGEEYMPDLGYDYRYRHRPLLEQRLTQAGLRLALTLNRIFSRQP